MSDAGDGETITPLRSLPGGAGEAFVELVEVGGRRYVLKRSSPARAAGERQFQLVLAAAGLPSLALARHPSLGAGDLLLEFVEGSPTLGGSPAPELCARWGAAVAAMHAIRTDGFLRLGSAGEIAPGSWSAFVERLIERALAAGAAAELPASLLETSARNLGELRGFAPTTFALVHGDLHVNNVLLRGDETVLFDKASRVWSCPPVFDLALVYSEGFPGARYGVSRPGDDARLDAFLAAYGDLPDGEWLDHFGLAHSLIRYPHPFVPELREIIDAALERLG